MKKNSFWETITTQYKFLSIAVLFILVIFIAIAIGKSVIDYFTH